jgi:hypothetical protein
MSTYEHMVLTEHIYHLGDICRIIWNSSCDMYLLACHYIADQSIQMES